MQILARFQRIVAARIEPDAEAAAAVGQAEEDGFTRRAEGARLCGREQGIETSGRLFQGYELAGDRLSARSGLLLQHSQVGIVAAPGGASERPRRIAESKLGTEIGTVKHRRVQRGGGPSHGSGGERNVARCIGSATIPASRRWWR